MEGAVAGEGELEKEGKAKAEVGFQWVVH